MKTPTIFLWFLTFGMVIFGILASPVSKAQYPKNIQNQNCTNTTFGDTTFYNRDQDNSTDLPLPPPPIQRQIHPSYSGHQLTSAFSSDSIACDGNIDTPYNCYQCFDAVAGKYFWGSSCKAKKLASADMVNGKCGLDYACTTKGIGTCPYNNYCPDNKKRFSGRGSITKKAKEDLSDDEIENLEWVEYDWADTAAFDGGVLNSDKIDNDEESCKPAIQLCSKVDGVPVCKKGIVWMRQNFNKDAESWKITTPYMTSQGKRNCYFEVFEHKRFSKQGKYKLIKPGTNIQIDWNIRSLRYSK